MAEEVKIKVTADTKQADSALSQLNKSWVGLNAGISLAKQAAQALGEAYKFLAGDTMEYAAVVRQTMRVSGQSAEMTSRMIQLTDDFAISNDTLKQAMKGATSNGIAFTIDALADLSDEYVKLKPGLEQATFAAEKFGARAGPEMQKLLEKGSAAIKAQGEAVADNMVLTQANIDKAEELRIAEDNLNDSFQGIKYTIGNAVIPILVEAADAFQLLITQEQTLTDALNKHNKDIINSGVNYDSYKKEVERTNEVARRGMTIWQAMGASFSFSQAQADKFIPSIRLMSDAEYLNAAAAAESDKRLMQWGNTLRTTANVDVPNAQNAIDAMGARYQAQADAIISANQKAADSIKNDISSALEVARGAAEEWVQGAGGDLATELQNADLSSGDLNEALIVLDGAMGTNAYWAKQQGDATKKIVDEYKRTGDVDAFKDALLRMKNGGYIPLIDSIKDAQLQLDILYGKLKLIDGTFRATVIVDLPGDGGGGGGKVDKYLDDDEEDDGVGYASGGSYMVPEGYYENYPVGRGKYASSGETVTITPKNEGAGVSIGVLNLTLPGVTNARQFADALGAMANNALNSGRAYQGG